METQIPETSITPLPCGMRLLHCRIPGSVEYIGVGINAGSRDEKPPQYGLAHFVEHTIFKGTLRRRACHIINRMEAIGGELNAYTTKDSTMIYTVAPAGYASRSLDLLADLVEHSRFPEHELDLEREVVIDEIHSYLDTPADNVFDVFDEHFFKGSPLAHNILGSEERVRSFSSADCTGWIRTHYTAPEMVAYYMGPEPQERVRKIASRCFSDLTPSGHGQARRPPEPAERFDLEIDQRNHQAHTVLGALIPGLYGEHRLELQLLNNVLGGPGMNARLNVELREKRGLVYSIDSAAGFYTDCGLLSIYYGCDSADNRRCLDLTLGTLDNLSRRGLTANALERAKRQYIGQIVVGSQNREQIALGLGRTLLRGLTPISTPELINRVRSITLADLEPVLSYFSPERFSRLTLL